MREYGTAQGSDDPAVDNAATVWAACNDGALYVADGGNGGNAWSDWLTLGAGAITDLEWCIDNAYTDWALGMKTVTETADHYVIDDYTGTYPAQLRVTYTPSGTEHAIVGAINAICSIGAVLTLISYHLTGITKDKDGNVLGSCHCFLVKDNGDDTCTYLDYQLSNAGTGVYDFTHIADNDSSYFVISWKDDTPHVFDVTDHVLQPTLVT